MNFARHAILFVGLVLLTGCQPVHSIETQPPLSLIVWDANDLSAVKEKLRQKDEFYTKAFKSLKQDAEHALKQGPFSVMNKTQMPPSGDKHDYMSVAPYWWPNPKTKSGLPYIQKDGLRNPAYLDPQKTDRRRLGEMCDAVETLTLCYYFTDEPRYAQRAALLLRTWFLDKGTRMNPNLNFGQAVPGQSTGRSYGIIETSHMIPLADCALVLKNSGAWTQKDEAELQNWFRQYVNWLITSPLGIEESNARNNHSTWYDAQTAVFALYVGDTKLAEQILRQTAVKHIDAKIEPDGRQPRELVRTKAFGYSTMNLRGTFVLARLGERFGIDLWNYESPDGRSLKKALQFLTPYAASTGDWPYQQIAPPDPAALYPLLKQARTKIKGFNPEPALKTLSDDGILLRRDVLVYP